MLCAFISYLFLITTTVDSTTIHLLTVNDGEDLISIKFRSFLLI